MYKKVFEKKFPDSSSATEFLDSTGWNYLGKKGILTKFHLYEGVTMMWDGSVSEKHKLRLYPDGHVVLYNDYNLRATLGVSDLPQRVWPSEEIYHYLNKRIDEYNDKLANEYGHQYLIENEWHKRYGLYKLETKEGSIGKVKLKPAFKTFESPKQAFDWAVSNIEKA